MSQVEFLVKLRDAAQMMADATNEYLETMAPVDVRDLGDFGSLKWTEKEGSKEPYQQTTKAANDNSKEFQTLQQKLKDKGGFFQTKGFKFWTHRDDPETIDRRKK